MNITEETPSWGEELEEKLMEFQNVSPEYSLKDQELLSFISNSLERSDQLTRGMVSILSSFESRLGHLENSVIPMHNNTESLMRLKETVNKTLFYLDDAISHYQVTRNTDKIIMQGPTGILPDYMACLRQIKSAVEYFQQDNPDGPELNMLKVRLERVKPLMESEFRTLLVRYSRPMSATYILDMWATKEGSKDVEEEIVDLLPKTVLQDIISISTWLTEYTDDKMRSKEDVTMTAKRSGSLRVVGKLKTLSLDRNPQDHLGPLVSTKMSSLKTLCNLKTLSLDRNPSLDKNPPLDVFAPLVPRCSLIKMFTLKTRHNLKTLSLERTPSQDKEPAIESHGKLEPISPLTKMSAIKPFSRLKTLSLDRHPSLEPLPCFSKLKSRPPFNPMSFYAQVRSTQLDRSIKGFKDHFRKGSVSSGSHMYLSPAIQSKHMDSPAKKTKTTGRESMLIVDQIEIDTFICHIRAFVFLATKEYNMLSKVFPPASSSKTFDSLIQVALHNLIQDGESIISSTRRACLRHEHFAVITMLPVLYCLTVMAQDFKDMLEFTSSDITKAKVSKFNMAMKATGAKALEELADYVKSNPDKENIPKDGTVHELNSNTILFLQQLLDLPNTVMSILPPHDAGIGNITMKVFNSVLDIQQDTEEKASRISKKELSESKEDSNTCSQQSSVNALSHYICRVLDNLQLNLRTKAKVYEDPALSAIFLLNNYNYILKSLKKSTLFKLVRSSGSDPEVMYGKLIVQQRQVYQHSWLKVTECLTDKNLSNIKIGDMLKEKDRQMIKDKYKAFNEGLEELCKVQKGWAIPDKDLRAAICQAQIEDVSKAYRAFLQRFGNFDFTKNPERYHKYCPEQVEEMIERLFDTSA